jgi:hypothetical protein
VSGGGERRSRLIDFERVNSAALANAERIAQAFIPDGRREGREWSGRNPLRGDRKPGSFKVNLSTGRWSDFATGDAGGDLVSLVAYLCGGLTQREAAIRLAESLGVDPYE